jgi:outer membrane cobalamin receptor
MKQIALTQNKIALVDDDDFEIVNQFKWSYQDSRDTGYAKRSTYPSKKTVLLHRFLLSATPDKEVDHINGDGLDNRRENLRLCSRRENHQNSKKKNNLSSIYKGVSWNKEKRKWRAQIRYEDRQMHLGYFNNEIDAAKAYDLTATIHFGEFAKLNFIGGRL